MNNGIGRGTGIGLMLGSLGTILSNPAYMGVMMFIGGFLIMLAYIYSKELQDHE